MRLMTRNIRQAQTSSTRALHVRLSIRMAPYGVEYSSNIWQALPADVAARSFLLLHQRPRGRQEHHLAVREPPVVVEHHHRGGE